MAELKERIPSQRPVVNAARTLGALAILLGLVPISVALFGVEWTAEQVSGYAAVSGGVVTAVALFLGVNVEKQVTPTANPKDDAGNMLTPGTIGNDEADLPPI